jgi:hypothetical protein
LISSRNRHDLAGRLPVTQGAIEMPALDNNLSLTTTLQVRLDALPASYSMFVKTLGASGLSGAVIQDVISNSLQATCTTCGITVTGTELSMLALAGRGESLADPKLARLAQGYCCRRGCDSYYYNLELKPHPSLPPDPFRARFTAAEPIASAPATGEDRGLFNSVVTRRALLIKVAAGTTLVLALLVGRHLWSGGSLRRGPRQRKYTADPASLPTVPRR